MMMQCHIRKATNDDIGALRELYLALEEDGVRYQPGNVDGMRFYERNGFCEMMITIECQSLD